MSEYGRFVDRIFKKMYNILDKIYEKVRGKMMKKNGWKIILAIAVLVCVVCLGRFGWIKYQNYKTEQARQETLKPLQALNLLERMMGTNQRKFQRELSMDRRLILRN